MRLTIPGVPLPRTPTFTRQPRICGMLVSTPSLFAFFALSAR
jgi:hypothetical protein